jgi:hypothetical protein
VCVCGHRTLTEDVFVTLLLTNYVGYDKVLSCDCYIFPPVLIPVPKYDTEHQFFVSH